MKKLLIVVSILAMASLAQAALPPSGIEPFDSDVFTGTGFPDWGAWASGSGSAGPGIGISPIGPYSPAGFARWVSTGGNPGGALEMGVLPSMNWWGRTMVFTHNTGIPVGGNVSVTTDVKVVSDAGTGFIIKIEWYGGLDKATSLGLASTLITGIGTSWTNVSFSAAVPVGANYFTPVFVAEGVGAHYMIDNVTPEPMTIALLGLGGLFLRRKK